MKAQFWSFDAIFALILFLSVIIIMSYVWSTMNSQLSVASGSGPSDMQAQAQTLAVALASQGYPENWYSGLNLTTPSSWGNITIGIGTGQGSNLDYRKIVAFIGMSSYSYSTYEASKSLLGISYDYYVVINNGDMHITMGRNPENYSATSVQVVDRSVVLNGRPAQMQVELWSNTSSGIV